VDVIEKPDALEVLADVPGATKESCDVVLEQGRLTIQAEVEEAEEPDMTLERREYDVGSYYRSFALGRGLDAEGVEATFQNGVLRLLIPKGEAYKPRRIEIQGE
jgi:HSP20 family molecular chaperone IbpA